MDRLIDEFSFFTSDISYYEDILVRNDNNIEYARKVIIIDLQEAWNNKNNDWVVSFIKKYGIPSFIGLLNKYDLEINMPILSDLLSKSPLLDNYLDQLLNKQPEYKISEIENSIVDGKLKELCICYLLLFDRITDEVEIALEDDYKMASLSQDNEAIRDFIINMKKFRQQYKDMVPFYLEQHHNYKNMLSHAKSSEEEKRYRELIIKYQNLIVLANLCLVFSVANNYYNSGVELIDLCQTGTEGLIKAIERYDLEKGFKLSTYAMWWIRVSIVRCLYYEGNAIKVPKEESYKYYQVHELILSQKCINGKSVSIPEIIEKTGYSKETVLRAFIDYKRFVSIDHGITFGNDVDENDYPIKDPDANFEEKTLNKILVNNLLKKLSKRQEFVIRMLYGIDNGTDERFKYPHTLDEVKKELKVSRTRVEQIRDKALIILNDLLCNNTEEKEDENNAFWTNFGGYSRHDVRLVCLYLTDDERDLIEEKYGKRYNENHDLGPIKNKRANFLITRIKKYLDTLSFDDKKESESIGLESSEIKCPIKSRFFIEIINGLPIEYREIVALRVGLKSGYMCEIGVIAAILKLDSDTVTERLEKGISLFKEMVENYRTTIDNQFPEMRRESEQILALLR